MLFPTIWSLLKYEKHSENDTISKWIHMSTINHAVHMSSKSGAKWVAMQFMGMLALVCILIMPRGANSRAFSYTVNLRLITDSHWTKLNDLVIGLYNFQRFFGRLDLGIPYWLRCINGTLQISSQQVEYIQTILRLLYIVQQSSQLFDMTVCWTSFAWCWWFWTSSQQVFTSVYSQLIPYFATMHPETGSMWAREGGDGKLG